MKAKTKVLAASVIILTGTLLAVCWAVNEPAEPWSLSGSWIDAFVGPDGSHTLCFMMLTPVDSDGNRYTFWLSFLNADYKVGGIWPEADGAPDMLGTAVRTGLNTYTYTALGYATKSRQGQRAEVLGTLVFSGKFELTGPDTMADTGSFVALYGPDADVNPVDGLPDEGATPFLCAGPMETSARRIGVMAPCTPIPMPQPPKQ